MQPFQRSSRERFHEYRRHLRTAREAARDKSDAASTNGDGTPQPQRQVEASHTPRQPEYRPLREMERRKAGFRQRTAVQLFLHFWAFLHGHRLRVIATLVALSAASLIALIPPYGTKLVIDNVLGGKELTGPASRIIPLETSPKALLAMVALGMLTVSLLGVLVGTWSRWHMTRVAKRLVVSVRRQVFDHAVRLPLHRVYELKSGGVASILREDAGAVGDMTFSLLYNPWRAIVQLLGVLVILSMTDWRLLLGGVAVLPVVWVTHRTWISRIRPLFRDVRATRRHIDGHATETFGGIRVVRTFGRARTESGQFTRNNHLMTRQELFAWWWMRGVDIAWAILIPGATAMLLWYGGWRIMADAAAVEAGTLDPRQALTVGGLVMFLVYLGWLLGPIATLAGTATGLQNNLAGLDRILDLMQEEREMPDKSDAVELDRSHVAGRITLREVGFTYPDTDAPVLSDVSLEAMPGQTVALVGPSGAGKTTLCNLVARFYDPTHGAILLDGTDLRDISLDSYRDLLGIVEQDVFLFDGSVRDNIAYSRRDASMDDIIAAAQRANAHGFISELPDGYDTFIGERGVKLSGGQRQRLSIARAVLADPKILILDEATSNLDTESEQLIQAALAELYEDRTTFVIAHRLSTVQHADLIVVLEQGRVVEMGRHEELLGRGGRYADMVRRQHAFTTDALPA